MKGKQNGAITRDLELEALQEAVHWPNAAARTVVVLAGQLMADRRDEEGYTYFRERAEARPEQPLFLALEGLFQARLAERQPQSRRRARVSEALGKLDRAVARAPGLSTYLRGLVLAELPAMLGRAEAAVADLEWVLINREQFPIGLRRNVYRGLARAYTALGRDEAAREALERSGYGSLEGDQPLFVADYWLTAADGFHFVPPRLVEPAPGVYVAQGYDFADFAFVLTDDGIVAIDAGTTEAHARAALADLRRVTDLPIRQVILTHAHWDHIGGLEALRQPGAEVIAQASFADELQIVNETGVPFRYFFGAGFEQHFDIVPDRLVSGQERLTIGGVEFGLYPARGETEDGLLVHLPASGVVFMGDVIMPYLGAPFLPEGSAEGLFETMRLTQSLEPRLLVHGHTGLTENFTIEAFPGLEAALRELHGQVLRGIRERRTLIEILHQNQLPDVLRAHPSAVVPFLVMRDNVVKRVYHQRTGYWKPDGEGMEHFAPEEWSAALDLLGGGKEQAFVTSARTLLGTGDHALALKLVDLGLLSHPASRSLAELRRQALGRLRERHQQLNPFKFIIYSELAGAELLPVDDGERAVPQARGQ
jgi:glyoxylase-like metal-dependent hydrolase (beta-lactamase superfamily II)